MKIELENYEAIIKTVIEINSHNLGKLVEEVYGGSFEFEAIEEATKGHYEHDMRKLGIIMSWDVDTHVKVRAGSYPMRCTGVVLHCLIEDGHIPNAIYMIDNNW